MLVLGLVTAGPPAPAAVARTTSVPTAPSAPEAVVAPAVEAVGAVATAVTAPPPARRAAAPLAASAPVRLQVPSLGLDSALVPLGLLSDGSLEVPAGARPAGWFTGAPTPGELGPAVLAGHVDLDGERGVFADLSAVAVGDEVVVERADASAAVFRVTRVQQVPKTRFPTSAVYGDLDHAGLRLITCGGALSRSRSSYADNVVVYAELVRTTRA